MLGMGWIISIVSTLLPENARALAERDEKHNEKSGMAIVVPVVRVIAGAKGVMEKKNVDAWTPRFPG